MSRDANVVKTKPSKGDEYGLRDRGRPKLSIVYGVIHGELYVLPRDVASDWPTFCSSCRGRYQPMRARTSGWYSAANGREKDYTMHPHRLVHAQGGLYLWGLVPAYGEPRTFAGR